MKKRNGMLLGLSAISLLSLALSSCGEQESVSSSENVDEIKQVYKAYQENGGTLSYEDWLASIKGEKGDKGDKGDQGERGPQGEQGEAGKDGVSITGIAKTSSSGDVDTYTITYSDSSTSSFTVTNGSDGKQGIQGEKGEGGHTPEVTIGANGDWFVDGVDSGVSAKGEKGDKGDPGEKGATGEAGKNGTDGKDGVSITGIAKTSSNNNVDTYTITYSDGTTSSFTVTNGSDGKDGVDGKDGSQGAQGIQGEKGDKGDTGEGGKDGVSVLKAYIDENGDLICEMSNGSTINAGHIKDVTKHTVNFYVDDEIVQTISVDDGAKLSAPAESETAGYTINYWYTLEGTFKCPWSFSGCTVTSDLNLYADYGRNSYAITFIDEEFDLSLASQTVTYDKEYSLPGLKNVGWVFTGWKTADGESFADSGVYRVASDLKLYADWTPCKYTVTLDPNGGSVSATSLEVAYGSEYTLPIPTTTEENKTFVGWIDSEGKEVSSSGTWTGTSDVALTAKWAGVQRVYTLDAGEGTCSETTITIRCGEAYELPTPAAPACATAGYQYVFANWYLDDVAVAQSGDSWALDRDGALLAKYRLVKGSGATPVVDSKTATYGLYPQAYVSDTSTISSLNALTGPDSNGWYYFDGDYYAKTVAKPDGAAVAFNNGTTIVSGTPYWFKCASIDWNILSSSSGEYFLVTSLILDAHRFNPSWDGENSEGYYANDYEESEIESWLHNDFYDSAFSLGNSCIQANKTYGNVYLPCYSDYCNTSYGFSSSDEESDTRICKTTDWARANGAYCTSDYAGKYWTRSSSQWRSGQVNTVSYDGEIWCDVPDDSTYGVRPAITIKVSE